jgi:hypothetical protein
MRKHIQRIQSSILLFFTLFALAACGGGGGTAPINNGGGGGGGADDPDDGSVSETYSIEVGLYNTDVDLDDLENSTEVSSVSSFGSAFFVARVTETATGEPVTGAIVSMTTSAGAVSPSQVLTNSNGVAATQVTADDASLNGAATLTATFSDVSQSQNFSFGSVDLQLGRDDNNFVDPDDIDFVDGQIAVAATSNLSAGGTTVLRVVVVSDNNQTEAFTSPLTIEFTSNCAAAELDTNVTTVNGIAASTFRSNSCEGNVDITANVAELTGVSATGSVFVESADVGSITFEESSPNQITLRGTGTDSSTVTFQVLDEIGGPANNLPVRAVLSSIVGGITINSNPSGEATENTDSNGIVSFTVRAGTVPTSVRIEATVDVDGTQISTISGALAITTGQPDNESFSLSASILNPGGFDFDGFNSELTVRAADSFNNPVPDGTTVIFTTEYGAIVGSCDTVEGACSATWTSQDERLPLFASTGRVLRITQLACDSNFDGTPDTDSGGGAIGTGNPCPTVLTDPADIDFPGQIYGGRSTILAYATGEESFIDSNGNGLYDVGEPFVDLAEAFIDKNEDGVFGGAGTSGACTGVGTGNSIVPVVDVNDIDGDGNTTEMVGEADLCADWQEGGAEEEFVDFNSNGIYDRGNGIYNGSLCQPTDAANGDCTTALVTVRDQVVLNVGGSTPFIEVYDSTGTQILADPDVGSGDLPVTRVFRISDLFNGPLPSGTTFNVATTNCEIGGPVSYTTPDSNSIGSQAFAVALAADDTPSTGLVTLTVEVPGSAGGIVATRSFSCTD